MAKNENKVDNKVKKHFFKDFKAELKRVIWPTPKQLVNNTTAVVTIVIITAIIVFALDAVFDLGNKYGISKLQSIVNEKYNNTESTKSTDNNSTENNTESTEDTSSTEENTSKNSDETPSTENTDGESGNEE
ncbi:MAG: preprotein translocase subunit SecE [Clostridium sp. 26_21]|nr:MAG: preprotein translocase subunit SecE [Clostridium sp. 26_21]